jgi:hypothetical protein
VGAACEAGPFPSARCPPALNLKCGDFHRQPPLRALAGLAALGTSILEAFPEELAVCTPKLLRRRHAEPSQCHAGRWMRTGCASRAESGASALPAGSAGALVAGAPAAPADEVTLRLTLPTSVDRTTDAKRSVCSVSEADLPRGQPWRRPIAAGWLCARSVQRQGCGWGLGGTAQLVRGWRRPGPCLGHSSSCSSKRHGAK